MIPKIIHYCWFGRGPMPEMALKSIESWHKHMPEWEYKLWNEDNFDVDAIPYTREAYEARKYAFVSDVARLKALYEEGGVYLDVDFFAYKSFEPLLRHHAFAGFEGSKHLPVMMGVCASEPGGIWAKEMLDAYIGRYFIIDGKMDLTPNVTCLTRIMSKNGLIQNGLEQEYLDLHIYPVDYFCPRQTTGEYLRTDNTYCESIGEPCKPPVLVRLLGQKNVTRLIKLKRKITG